MASVIDQPLTADHRLVTGIVKLWVERDEAKRLFPNRAEALRAGRALTTGVDFTLRALGKYDNPVVVGILLDEVIDVPPSSTDSAARAAWRDRTFRNVARVINSRD